MDIAKLLYISLTVITAWLFVCIAFQPFDSVSSTKDMVRLFLWSGFAAFAGSWLAYRWLCPVSLGKYLLCGLLTALLFHVGLALWVGIESCFTSFAEEESLFVRIATSVIVPIGMSVGAFCLSLMKAGLYSLWLCTQTAAITKGVMWMLDKQLKGGG